MVIYTLIYLANALFGVGLFSSGYVELRTKRYEGYYRNNPFRRAKLIVVEGNIVIPVAIWHMVAGIVICIASIYMLFRHPSYALGFPLIWVPPYVIIELLVWLISGLLTRHYQQTGSEASDVEESLQE